MSRAGGPYLRYVCEPSSAGIPVAAQRCLRALTTQRDDVAWEPLIDTVEGRLLDQPSEGAPAWMRALRRPRHPDDVAVLHSVPWAWPAAVERLGARHVIGHLVWELDRLPEIWRRCIEPVDEFWVPTDWNRRAVEAVTDRPVHVIPHVTSDVDPVAPPMQIPDHHRVVTMVSAWDWRKRPDRTLRAALRAADGLDEVTVVLKTGAWDVGWPGSPVRVADMIDAILADEASSANVLVDTSIWSDAQVAGLVERTSCFVSLTSAEGWGLGPFDAACAGVPVVITGFGGQVEYLGEDYPGLLPHRMVPPVHEDPDLVPAGVQWAYPDMDAAVERVRGVLDGSDTELVEAATTLAPRLRERFSPEAVGALAAAAVPSDPPEVAVATPTDPPSVLILTPVKQAAHHAAGYVDRVLALEHRPISVGVLVSDSDDDSAGVFRTEFERLSAAGIPNTVVEHDYGYQLPPGVPRWEPGEQLARRTVLARSRNRLLSTALTDEEWVLWLDADVVGYPTDVVERLLAVGGDIVHPNCVRTPGGSPFDRNAWTDHGVWHLDAYRGSGVVELHSVGGTMLLVRADHHRDGLVFPAFPLGGPHPRVRPDPARIGRPEIGEVETEGLAMMAHSMGVACWGLPDLEIVHE